MFSKLVRYSSSSNSTFNGNDYSKSNADNMVDCPFLHSVNVEPVNQNLVQDIERDFMKEKQFDYNQFFNQKIADKKKDHSYRVFKKVLRSANNPPFGDEYTFNKPIKVWCSNDYLGMSSHVKVKQAVMYVHNLI